MKTSGWIQLIALSLLWGGSFLFVEFALEGFGPLTLVLIRVSLAAATLAAVAAMQNHRIPHGTRLWRDYFIMGLLANALPFTLISWGQQHITAGLASILNALVPFFTVLIAHRFSTDERISRNKVFGVLLGWLGVAVLTVPEMKNGLAWSHLGQLAVVAAAASYAAAAVFGKRFSGRPPVVNATAMLACSTVLLLPVAFLVEDPLGVRPNLGSWAGVIALAVLSSAMAYLLYFRILKSEGASRLSLVTLLIPMVALFLGGAILRERMGAWEWGGITLILTALILFNRRPFTKADSPGKIVIDRLSVVTDRPPQTREQAQGNGCAGCRIACCRTYGQPVSARRGECKVC